MFSSDLTTIAARFRKLIRGDFGVEVSDVGETTSYICESGDYYVIIRMLEIGTDETGKRILVPSANYRIDFCGPDHTTIEFGV